MMMEEPELPHLLKKKNNDIIIIIKAESHLDEQDWERQTAKHIAYNLGMLFNDSKKIVCLQNAFKIFHT